MIIDLLEWRWIHLFYAPVGLAALIWGLRILREAYRPPREVCLGILGFTLFLFSIAIGLTLMLNAAKWVSEIAPLMALATIFIALP